MDIDLAALRAPGARARHLPRRAHPRDRAGAAGGLPPHRGRPPASRASSSTARPVTSSSGPVRRASSPAEGERRASPGPSSTTPRRASAGSPPSTARQVIVQRLRDLEDDADHGRLPGREGDVVAGVIQQSTDPRNVLVDFGTVEGVLPLAEQVPGEKYVHGERLRCFVVSVKRGPRGPADRPVAHPPQPRAQAVRPRGPRDRRRHGRDRGPGPRGRPPHQDRRALQGARRQRQGRLHRPDGRSACAR